MTNPLISGLFQQFKATEELGTLKNSDAFELFIASLLLPDEVLQQIPLTDLLLDDSTMGVDIAVMLMNGQVVHDKDDVDMICASTSKVEVELHLIQAKQTAGVDSAQILNFGDIAQKFVLNEGLDEYLKLKALAVAFRAVFDEHAGRLKGSLPVVSLSYVTSASRMATQDGAVQDRVATVRTQLEGLGFLGPVRVEALGADDIHEVWVKKNHANEVEIQLEKQVNLPPMPGIDQAILGVVSAAELLKLIKTDQGGLDERVFYDNVRGFKGLDNPVNAQIIETLESPRRELLPVLNNGVTVVAESYSPKPGDAVRIGGFQVVNGCQTSHCIYLSRDTAKDQLASTFVPIRLVITGDSDVATRIIRATNSQTEVQETDLVALSQFQKRLEDFYILDTLDVKLTYERRSGQFYQKEVTKTRVVSITDQMRAVSALFLDSPHAAARYTGKLFDEVGKSIFKEDHRLSPYVASAFAAYRLENAFKTGLESRYKPARYHILTAYKYAVLNGPSAPLNSGKSEEQSASLVQSLKRSDLISVFRDVADQVVSDETKVMPTPDRLKRQPFTQELVSSLARRYASTT